MRHPGRVPGSNSPLAPYLSAYAARWMPEQVRHDEKQMPDLSRILSAKQPLTLSGTPAGFLPWLLADLARAADKRAIFIAADEVDMRAEIGRASCRERLCQYV